MQVHMSNDVTYVVFLYSKFDQSRIFTFHGALNFVENIISHIAEYTHKMPRPKREILAAAESASSPPSKLPPHHLIARVIKAQGNSLFSVTLPSTEELLVELEGKLRNTFWIKRGGYVIVDTEALADRDNKLGGEIVTVIMAEKQWRKMAYWPGEFGKRREESDSEGEEESNIGKMPPSDGEDEDEDEDEEG